MKKNYVIDSNILLQDPNAITTLINGEENNVFIPIRTILELDKLKREGKLNHLISRAISSISKNMDKIKIIQTENFEDIDHPDIKILKDIKDSKLEDPILVSNDKIFRLISSWRDVEAQEYLNILPFKSESEIWSGILLENEENKHNAKNYFVWKEGKIYFKQHNKKEIIIDHINKAWEVTPRKSLGRKNKDNIEIYENLALELLLNNDIKLITLQGTAGAGKSYISLAAALETVLVKKLYDKIIIIKPIVEVGDKIGYLPGTEKEKLEPHIRYLYSHLEKLKKNKDTKSIYKKGSNDIFDPSKFEIIPMTYLRGADIENAFVIIEEAQNCSRDAIRTILTRLGYNTKVVLTGDTKQVDAQGLSPLNNGLNWTVQKMKDSSIYAHLCLKSDRSRGPIAEAVIKSGL